MKPFFSSVVICLCTVASDVSFRPLPISSKLGAYPCLVSNATRKSRTSFCLFVSGMGSPPLANLSHRHFRRKESERQLVLFSVGPCLSLGGPDCSGLTASCFTAVCVPHYVCSPMRSCITPILAEKGLLTGLRRCRIRTGVISFGYRLRRAVLEAILSLHRLILLTEPCSPGVVRGVPR